MTKLIGVGDLFNNTWKIYREKFSLVVGLMVLPFLLMALNQVLLRSGEGPVSMLNSLVGLVACLAVLWGGASILLILNSDQVLTIKEAYRLSWGKLIALIWVAILVMFIAGGSIMLFVIPGIILSVWLAFAQVIVVLEGEKGLRAIVKSREYVRDYFWPILGRLLAMAMIMTIACMVLMALAGFVASSLSSLGSLAFILVLVLFGAVINILVLPLGVIYTYLLYGSVKQAKGEVLIDPAKKQGLRYILVGLAGWVLVALVSIFFLSLLVTLFAGLFFGQALGGLNLEAQKGLSNIIPTTPIEVPAGLTAEQRQQMQVQLEAMKKLQEQLKAQMPAGIPVPTE